MSADETLSLSLVLPGEEKASSAFLVRLGLVLTIEGRSLPFELAFCSGGMGPNSSAFLVKAGARSAICHHCGSRHKILSLIEALKDGEITIGGGHEVAIPSVTPEEILGVMFRELASQAAAGRLPL